MENPPAYQAYLIRLWPGERAGRSACRATLDTVSTGQHYDFADVEDLLTFLRSKETELAHPTETVDRS
jgi:hypothetical protein